MIEKKMNWGIVGGGVLGMTLALRLANAGHKVTIYEKNMNLGGLLKSAQMGDVTWDAYYHVILKSDLRLRALLKEIDLEKDINWVETKTGFYTNGKFQYMSGIVDFLKFPAISLIDKFRLGVTILYAYSEKNWRKLEQISVEKWLRRLSGNNTFEKIWKPLLISKLGESYKEVPASFIWATIQRMYAARKSGVKREMFGYVNGGYSTILKSFVTHLQNIGVEIKTGSPVKSVAKSLNQKIKISLADNDHFDHDQVIVTTPSPMAVNLCPEISEKEKHLLQELKYIGVICPSLLLKKSLGNCYITNITDSWVPFTGIIEMSALVDKSNFKGATLVYLPKYIPSNDEKFDLTDEQIVSNFYDALRKVFPHLEKSDLIASNVARARFVFTQPTFNYSKNLPGISTTVKNLHIVNNAHIVNGTNNVNEIVQLVDNTLEKIISGITPHNIQNDVLIES